MMLANPAAARRKRENEKNCDGGGTAASSTRMLRSILARHERAVISEPVCASNLEDYSRFIERALDVVMQSYVDARKLKQE